MPVLRAHADDAPALLEQVGGCLNELQDGVMELKVPDLKTAGWPPVRCAARVSTAAGWQRRCAGPCQACDCTIGLAACAARAQHELCTVRIGARHARGGVATYALGCAGNGRDAQAAVVPDCRRHSAARSSCRAVRPGQCNRRQAGAWPGYSGVGKVPSSKSLGTPGSLLKSETCQRPLIAST